MADDKIDDIMGNDQDKDTTKEDLLKQIFPKKLLEGKNSLSFQFNKQKTVPKTKKEIKDAINSPIYL